MVTEYGDFCTEDPRSELVQSPYYTVGFAFNVGPGKHDLLSLELANEHGSSPPCSSH